MKNITDKIRTNIQEDWLQIDYGIEAAGFDWHYIYHRVTYYLMDRVCEPVRDCIQDQIEDITDEKLN